MSESFDSGNEEIEDSKLPAKGGKKLVIVERDAVKLFDATKEQNKTSRDVLEKKGLPLQPYDKLLGMTKVLNNIIPFDGSFYKLNGTDGMEKVENHLMRSSEVRKGLQQMVNQSISLVDLFSFYKEQVFSMEKDGITKAIQFLMSK